LEIEAKTDDRRVVYETLYDDDDDLEEFRLNIQILMGTCSDADANADTASDEAGRVVRGGFPQDHHHGYDDGNSPFLALCAGIVHGLAGPGGVLGVVPAIQLHDAGLAACYLVTFCASSTLTMGTFAAAYGTFTSFLAKCWSRSSKSNSRSRSIQNNDNDNDDSSEAAAVVEFWIRCFSSSLSVLVGVVWLVLLAMGKLEDVFG